MSVILIRKEDEAIVIGRHIRVRIRSILTDHVEVIVEAPEHLPILREEITEQIRGLAPNLSPRITPRERVGI